MQSNSELANSWNIRQNSEEENTETDIEDDLNEVSSEETKNSNKSLTKYTFFKSNLLILHKIFILLNYLIIKFYYTDYCWLT